MPRRVDDWLRQADKDLKHAKNAMDDGDYEWSCFAAQQAAEKAMDYFEKDDAEKAIKDCEEVINYAKSKILR